ncbi:MAG: MarR family transcriptional regulator [Candidatus Eisenbacteria bacterium]|nr:MarR family transcriptional regulator [Candidatus Latescibacterota bacterium]MBD3301321.1 MarR family transcriptional regulator [Candidatus Eisenbacteria bacterium]
MHRNRTHASLQGESTPELGEVLNFMRLLWAVDHGLHTASKQMVRRSGISGPQRLVIRILGQAPELSAGTLARVLHIHPSTLTGILHRLEERGFILRSADPADARKARLTLTDLGRRVDAERTGTVEEAIAALLESQPPARIAAAVQVLMAIAEGLGVEEPL